LNRMVAACRLPTILRAEQAFTSLYPPKPRRMNDTKALPRYSSVMKLPLCVRPSRGARATPRWTQLADRFWNRPPIKGVRVRSDHAKGIANHALKW